MQNYLSAPDQCLADKLSTVSDEYECCDCSTSGTVSFGVGETQHFVAASHWPTTTC